MNGWLWFVLVVLCFYFNENVPQVWLSLTRPNLYTWNPKFFFGQVVGYNIFIFIFDFLRTPTLPTKKLGFFTWSSSLHPTRRKDVRGLAADGSSETQGLLKMNVWLCWPVVVLWHLFNQNMAEVWLSLTCENLHTWNPKLFLGRWLVKTSWSDKTR